jgi:hypothetical protein
MREYKEDSTRGKALVRPRSYKGDSLVQAWVDRRKLAMLSIWLDNGGYNTRHLSEVVKLTIDEVVERLIESGIVKKIEFTGEATQIIAMKYKADLNPSGRGLRNLSHNLHLDEMRRGKAFEGEISYVSRDPEMEDVRETTRKMVEKYRELEKAGFPCDREKQERESRDAMERVRGEFDVGEDGVMRRKSSKDGLYKLRSEEEVRADIERIEKSDRELAAMDLSKPEPRFNKVVKLDN